LTDVTALEFSLLVGLVSSVAGFVGSLTGLGGGVILTPVLRGRRGPADLITLLAVVGLLASIAWLGHGLWAPFVTQAPLTIDLDPRRLPYYAARSLLRMFLALGASLIFTLIVGSWAARSPRSARIILPGLDILQSVPVLGFLSATVMFFVSLTPGHLLGLELAAIFAIFTSQVWNLTFAFYHALMTLPRDQAEALRLYRVSGWQRFTHFELPAAVIPLVWNGMMSFGGGWFFLAASEAITVLGHEFLLPGLGSYAAVAVKRHDLGALAWGLLAMTALIVLVDRAFWRPLVAWSQKFRLEQSEAEVDVRSKALDVLRRSHIGPWLGDRLARLDEALDRLWRRWAIAPHRSREAARHAWVDRAVTLAPWAVLGALAVRGAAFVATAVAGSEILRVVAYGALTLSRVIAVVAVSTLLWTPLGVWIGLNPRVSRTFQPVVQTLAAFPANFAFPLVTVALLRWHLSLELSAAFLMALGAQWYVLFNTIAGAMAIPNDLREMARDLGVTGWSRWRAVVLPAIFPAWVTGALTAAGGAWNASIVAEVVTWGQTTLTATGLGSYIASATTAGDWPRIVLGVAVMSAYVVVLNQFVWRPLVGLAAARFRLE
jgi:NitT/TauT family transport system permease protein